MFLQVSVCPRGGGGKGACSGGGCLVLGGLLWGVVVVCSGGCLLPRGGLVSQHALRQTPPGETATAADGTHPTGMHSCLHII